MSKEKLKGGRSEMSSVSDAILIETFKKELKFFSLYENYMLSPNAIKSRLFKA
jgi:hypothetical protein